MGTLLDFPDQELQVLHIIIEWVLKKKKSKKLNHQLARPELPQPGLPGGTGGSGTHSIPIFKSEIENFCENHIF